MMRKSTKRILSGSQKWKERLEELRLLAAKPVENVRQVERRMVKIYEKYCREDIRYFAVDCINDLKQERWRLMRDRFEWTAENIARLEAANEYLKTALLEMRRKTIEVYEAAKEREQNQDIYVEGTLWVEDMTFEDWEQNEDMQIALFDVMATKTYGGFYANSVCNPFWLQYNAQVTDTPDTYDSENQVLYLEDKLDNWNELMPRDKTAHLHLVYAVHNLYEHCNWSLQDIINIKSYKTEIMIEYSPRNERNME